MSQHQPRPQYLRPLAPGVRERAAHAGRSGHYRPRMMSKTTTNRHDPEGPALFATYGALLRYLAIWLVLALAVAALAALAGLLVLASVWLGQHALLWIGGLLHAAGHGR